MHTKSIFFKCTVFLGLNVFINNIPCCCEFTLSKPGILIKSGYESIGSLGIAPTRNCTHFLKIGFGVAGDGFYSYYIHQGNKSDKEVTIVRKKLRFMH